MRGAPGWLWMWIQEVAVVCPADQAYGEDHRDWGGYGIGKGNKVSRVTNLHEEQQLPREGRGWRDSKKASSQGYLFILFPG